jgi:hypothetical protein
MMDVNSENFDALPPHFDVVDAEVDGAVTACFPGAQPCMRPLLVVCLASLVYHRQFFAEKLHTKHHLFQTPFFTQQIGERLAHRVKLSFDSDTMAPTGIPAHVGIQRRVVEVRELVESIPGKVRAAVSAEFEQRAVDAGSITRDTLREMMTGMFDRLIQSMSPAVPPSQPAAVPDNERPAFSMFNVNGQLRRLPEGFQFDTTLPAEVLFQLYCCGDFNAKISPYHFITPMDCPTQKERKTLSDLKALMNPVEAALKRQALWKNNPTIVEANEMWAAGKGSIAVEAKTAKGRTRRNAQIAWSTQLKEVRKRARLQEDDSGGGEGEGAAAAAAGEEAEV